MSKRKSDGRKDEGDIIEAWQELPRPYTGEGLASMRKHGFAKMSIDTTIECLEDMARRKEKRAERVRNRPAYACDFYGEEDECRRIASVSNQLAEWLKELREYKERQEDDLK